MKNLVLFAILINVLQCICTCPDRKASVHIQNYDGTIFLQPFNYPAYDNKRFDDEICHRNQDPCPNTHTEIECTCVTKQQNSVPINNVPINNLPINHVTTNYVPQGTCYNSYPQLFTMPIYSNSIDKVCPTDSSVTSKHNPNCRIDGVSVTYGQSQTNCQYGTNYGCY